MQAVEVSVEQKIATVTYDRSQLTPEALASAARKAIADRGLRFEVSVPESNPGEP